MAVQFSFSSDEVLELNPGPPKQYYHLASSLFQYTIGYTDASCTVTSTRAGLDAKTLYPKISYRMLRHLHEKLNIDEIKN